MPDRIGNVLRPPGQSSVAQVLPEEILASYARFTQKGVTLAGGQGVLVAGTALGRVTATKKYQAYSDGNSPAGVGVCLGFLRDSVDTGSAGHADMLGNIVLSGILKNSKLIGLDANGVADLNGRQDTVNDMFIF